MRNKHFLIWFWCKPISMKLEWKRILKFAALQINTEKKAQTFWHTIKKINFWVKTKAEKKPDEGFWQQRKRHLISLAQNSLNWYIHGVHLWALNCDTWLHFHNHTSNLKWNLKRCWEFNFWLPSFSTNIYMYQTPSFQLTTCECDIQIENTNIII